MGSAAVEGSEGMVKIGSNPGVINYFCTHEAKIYLGDSPRIKLHRLSFESNSSDISRFVSYSGFMIILDCVCYRCKELAQRSN